MFVAISRCTNSRITNGLNNSIAISFGKPHWYILRTDQRRLRNDQNSQHVYLVSFDGNDLVSLSTCERDFNGRLPGPVTGRPRRPLSIKASTASCNIRFRFER